VYRFKTLDFYVFREVLGPLCLGLLVLTFALVVGRLLKLIEMMVNHGVTPLEILRLLGEGRSLQQIADALGLSYKTIANNSAQIKAKLGVQRTAELIRIAVQNNVSSET